MLPPTTTMRPRTATALLLCLEGFKADELRVEPAWVLCGQVSRPVANIDSSPGLKLSVRTQRSNKRHARSQTPRRSCTESVSISPRTLLLLLGRMLDICWPAAAAAAGATNTTTATTSTADAATTAATAAAATTMYYSYSYSSRPNDCLCTAWQERKRRAEELEALDKADTMHSMSNHNIRSNQDHAEVTQCAAVSQHRLTRCSAGPQTWAAWL